MNKDVITIQDCLDMHHCRGQAAIISNGRVLGFISETSLDDLKRKTAPGDCSR